MGTSPNRHESLDVARLAIARFQAEGDDGPSRAIRHATRVSAEKLMCERVGVWLFVDESKQAITAPIVYDLSRAAHDEDGVMLDSASCPAYFEALREKRVVAVSDALEDPRTRELAEEYLIPRGIRALLDVPIYRAGDIVGVLCHEHAGYLRTWTEAERAFAVSVADMLAVVLEGARLLDCERKLRQAERREHDESIARVAGALGHDVNNLLTVILTATSSLSAEGDAEAVAVIKDAAQRGAALARELLLLSRGEEGPSRAPALAPFVLESLKPVLQEIVAPHALDWSVDLSAVRVPADPQELERIVVNLVTNARQALSTEGDEGRVGVFVSANATDVVLEVRDTGHGMSPSTLRRIFDPFFSTKGHGSGLGLASVKAIVGRRGGRVRVESREGEGTTFAVTFPRV